MQRRQKSVVEEKPTATATATPKPHAPVNSPPTPSSQSGYDEGTTLRIDQLHAKPTTPRFVYVLTTFSAIGGFLFGYDTGVISGAMILLRDEFLLSYVWQELVVSVTIASAAIFALVGGSLNDSVGRKPVILVASLIFTVGALCLACATDRFMLLFGRFLVGAGIGFTSTTIPMYIAESAPAYVRGRLVSTNVLMIACGQFVANVVAGIFSYNKENGWRYMLGIGAVPSIIQFVGFCFMPESPRWLILRGRDDEARMVLQKIRGETEIDEEFDSVKMSCMEAKKGDIKQHSIFWKMIKTPSVRRALIVGCGMQMIQQLAGINTVMYYSATIITMSGVRSETAAIWLSAVMAAVNFAFSFVGLYLVERIGRRPLTITSLVGTIASLIWLSVGFDLSAVNSPQMTMNEVVVGGSHCSTYRSCNSCVKDLYCGYCYVNSPTVALNGSCLPVDYNKPVMALNGRCNSTHLPGQLTWAYDFCPTQYAWMPLVGLMLYLICFAPGMGPMPWTVNSEIYPMWARSTGNSAATFTNWMFNLAVSMSFLSLTEVLTKEGTFALYAGLASLGLIFICFLQPETKGMSLEEVEGVFAKPWCGSEGATIPFGEKTVQYVHIRGLNRDGRDSEMDSPE